MVPASAHVREVYLGRNGVLEGLAKLGKHEASNTLCIDESTIEQSESRKVAAAIRATGAEMIDAPVSGGE
jgi:3-hydroxyisobutyrate dehydrogenase